MSAAALHAGIETIVRITSEFARKFPQIEASHGFFMGPVFCVFESVHFQSLSVCRSLAVARFFSRRDHPVISQRRAAVEIVAIWF